MRFVLFSLLLASTTALAQPAPGAFVKGATFQSCQTTHMFACGMPSPDGRGHYGTAFEREICTTYTFRPDGTYAVAQDVVSGEGGTYRIRGGKVVLTEKHDDGTTRTYELVLSPDGTSLSGMKRLR